MEGACSTSSDPASAENKRATGWLSSLLFTYHFTRIYLYTASLAKKRTDPSVNLSVGSVRPPRCCSPHPSGRHPVHSGARQSAVTHSPERAEGVPSPHRTTLPHSDTHAEAVRPRPRARTKREEVQGGKCQKPQIDVVHDGPKIPPVDRLRHLNVRTLYAHCEKNFHWTYLAKLCVAAHARQAADWKTS